MLTGRPGGAPLPVPRDPQGLAGLTAQEAGFVEAAAFTLDLLGEVHGLLAHAASLASSPVRHSETGHGNGNSFTGPRRHGRPGQAATGRACGGEEAEPSSWGPVPPSCVLVQLRQWQQTSLDVCETRAQRTQTLCRATAGGRPVVRDEHAGASSWTRGCRASPRLRLRSLEGSVLGTGAAGIFLAVDTLAALRPKALSLPWAPEGRPQPRGRARGNGHLFQPHRVAWT